MVVAVQRDSLVGITDRYLSSKYFTFFFFLVQLYLQFAANAVVTVGLKSCLPHLFQDIK